MGVLQFKKVNCKNCYKCVRSCPVKSIRVKDHAASVIESECILCGTCTIVCPQHAKEDRNDVSSVRELISAGRQVIASVAPSFTAYFGVGFGPLRQALLGLGFYEAFETAEGAYLVKSEYEKLIRAGESRALISSCCACVNSYIKKYRPEAQKFLAPVLTPMQAHARLLRQRFPGAAFVFIGPCLAKKAEAEEENSDVEAVLLFEEAEEWLETEGLLPLEPGDPGEPRLSRLFPVPGGVLDTMEKGASWEYLSVDGFESVSKTVDDMLEGRLDNCFVEMNFCRGGCIGGPSFKRKGLGTALSRLAVRRAAGTLDPKEDFLCPDRPELSAVFNEKKVLRMQPSTAQIEAVLRQMGKNSPEDELNCGMCGYSTCREKALAVLRGKAEISMCLPYIRERAEGFAGKIIDSMPSAVLSVDMSLRVRQINPAACEIFGLDGESLIGQNVRTILDEADFVSLLSSESGCSSSRVFLPDYGVYLEQTLRLDRENETIICVLKNVTEEKLRQRRLLHKKQQAAEIADEIVEKQLRMVHEIASLLGEAAAETKIAVSDLKSTVMLDSEDG